ncbi:hypothetical protein FOA52_009902 [Chlamydomonas sp. UWO 241]|nr:hypothetical protein FOA52_009902 [Chlamydomonas sp. UWO 241]
METRAHRDGMEGQHLSPELVALSMESFPLIPAAGAGATGSAAGMMLSGTSGHPLSGQELLERGFKLLHIENLVEVLPSASSYPVAVIALDVGTPAAAAAEAAAGAAGAAGTGAAAASYSRGVGGAGPSQQQHQQQANGTFRPDIISLLSTPTAAATPTAPPAGLRLHAAHAGVLAMEGSAGPATPHATSVSQQQQHAGDDAAHTRSRLAPAHANGACRTAFGLSDDADYAGLGDENAPPLIEPHLYKDPAGGIAQLDKRNPFDRYAHAHRVLAKMLKRDPMLTFALQKAVRHLKAGEAQFVSHATPDPSGRSSFLVGLRLTPVVWRAPALPGAPPGEHRLMPALLIEHDLPYDPDVVMPRLMRDYAVLSHVPAILTLIDFNGRVLYQNANSLEYMGDLVSAKYSDALSEGLLLVLYKYDESSLEDMLEDVLTGNEWQGVVQVPHSLRRHLTGCAADDDIDIVRCLDGDPRRRKAEAQPGSFSSLGTHEGYDQQQPGVHVFAFSDAAAASASAAAQRRLSMSTGGEAMSLSPATKGRKFLPLLDMPGARVSSSARGSSSNSLAHSAVLLPSVGAHAHSPGTQPYSGARASGSAELMVLGRGQPFAGLSLDSSAPMMSGRGQPSAGPSHDSSALLAIASGVDQGWDEVDAASCREGEDVEEEEDDDGASSEADCYHEVHAIPLLDPVLDEHVIMLVQTDVTPRVELENKLADLTDAQLSMLEQLFPRHIIEFMLARVAPKDKNLRELANNHERVMVLFCDVIGFTSMSKQVQAQEVMNFLNTLYETFDGLVDDYGMYKLDTVGDCYIVVAGLIKEDQDGFVCVDELNEDQVGQNAVRIMQFAKAMLREALPILMPHNNQPVSLRIGIHTGPLVSGLVGSKMPKFTLFGDTINTASRMESTCRPACVHVSDAFAQLLPHEAWESTGGVEVKGKGMMSTFLWSPSADRPELVLPAAQRGRNASSGTSVASRGKTVTGAGSHGGSLVAFTSAARALKVPKSARSKSVGRRRRDSSLSVYGAENPLMAILAGLRASGSGPGPDGATHDDVGGTGGGGGQSARLSGEYDKRGGNGLPRQRTSKPAASGRHGGPRTGRSIADQSDLAEAINSLAGSRGRRGSHAPAGTLSSGPSGNIGEALTRTGAAVHSRRSGSGVPASGNSGHQQETPNSGYRQGLPGSHPALERRHTRDCTPTGAGMPNQRLQLQTSRPAPEQAATQPPAPQPSSEI